MGQLMRLPEKRAPPTTWWPDHLFICIGETFWWTGIFGSGYYFGKGFIQPQHARVRGRFATGLGLARANFFRVSGMFSAGVAVQTVVEQGLYYYFGRDQPFNTAVSCAVGAAAVTAARGPLFASRAALAFAALGLLHHYTEPAEEENLNK